MASARQLLLASTAPRGTTPILSLNFAGSSYFVLAGYVRTNYVPNSTMVGATASTLPTGWSFQAAAGLTQSVVGIGTEFGRNYVDWSIVGTTTGVTFPALFLQPNGLGGAAASAGQIWTGSLYLRVVSGSFPSGYFQPSLNAFTSAGAYISSVGGGFNAPTTFSRQSVTGTLPATTAFVQAVASFNSLPAGTYNVVLRVYQPQLEQAGYPSSDIPTSGSPVSVTTYASSNPADVGNLTYTRAGTAYAPDSAGNLIAFGDGQIRVTNLGYWAEESRTNSIPNSTANNGAVAGTPGTLPTGWAVDYNPSGLSTQVVGMGTEGGVPYVDWRVFGTMAAAGQINLSTTNTITIVAAQGQTWTATEYIRAVAGSATNLTYVSMSIADESAAGGYLSSSQTDYSSANLFSTTKVTQNRLTHTRTLANALTARVLQSVVLFSVPGGAVDITLRIAAPQMEQGANASTYIPTTSGPVTRAADVGYYTIPSLSTAYTLAAVGSSSSASGNFPTLAQLDGGTDANRSFLYGNASASTTVGGARVDFGSVTQSDSGSGSAFTNGTPFGVALSVQASRMARSTNGNTVNAGSGTVPTVNTLRLGVSQFSTTLNGPLSKTAVWSSALNDNETIYRSAGNF